MLFVLQDDVLPYCSATHGPELEGLQNLLLAIRQGAHALAGPHAAFVALAKNGELSQRERAIAHRLANRRSELPLLERRLLRKVRVVASCQVSPERVNGECWRVRLPDLSARFFSASTVLAENAVDAEVYARAAEHYRIAEKLNGVVVRCAVRGGGGSQIDVELRELLGSGTPVMAVTDGDLKHPNGGASVVSNRCDAAIAAGIGIGWHTSVPVREAENLIPLPVLMDAAIDPGKHDADSFLKVLQDVENAVGSNPCHFTCFKSGKRLRDVFNCEDEAEKKYWLKVVAELDKKSKKYRECLSNGECQVEPCTCWISHGYGEGILKLVNAWFKGRSSHEALKSFHSTENWLGLGRQVFEAGVAFRPEAV